MARDIDEILGKGFCFDPTDAKILSSLQSKYSREYLPFIKSIVENSKGEDVKLNDFLFLIQTIVQNLGKLLSGRLGGETGHKLLKKLFEDIKKTEEGFNYVKKLVDSGMDVSEALNKLEEKTGASFNDLIKKHKVAREYVETIKPKKTGVMATAMKGTAETVSGVGQAAISGLLGPFAGLAGAGLGAIKGITGGVGALMRKRRGAGATQASEALLGGVGGTAPSLTPSAEVLQAALPAKTISQPTVKLKGQALTQAADPIFYFFDRLAHKASWTAQVLDILKKTVGDMKGKKGSGLLSGLGLGTGLSALLTGGAIAGLVVTITALGIAGNKLLNTLREMKSGIVKWIDVFKPFLPGGSLLNPLKGPQQMAEASAEFGRIISTAVGNKVEEFFKGFKESGTVTEIKSPGAPLSMGKPGTSFASLPVTVNEKELIKETAREREKESKSTEIREKLETGTVGLLAKLIDRVEVLTKTVTEQTSELKPKYQGFSMPNKTEVPYASKNPIIDGANSGRIRP